MSAFDEFARRNTKPQKRKDKRILLTLMSTTWFIYAPIPIVPVGAILGLLIFRPRKALTYLLVLLAALLGFAGTGFHVSLIKEKRINLDSGKEFFVTKYNGGIRLGIDTIDHLLNGNKIKIYSGSQFKNEIDQANEYVLKFTDYFNDSDSTFLMETFLLQQGITEEHLENVFRSIREKGGKILSTEYIGYVFWQYPNRKHNDITVVHKVEFEKEPNLGSIQYRIIFQPDEIKLIRIDFIDSKSEYQVIEIK